LLPVQAQQKRVLLQALIKIVHKPHLLSERLFEGVVPGEYVV